MAHIRQRSMTGVVSKEMKFWPVICLLGPRQCGKSTLLRELFLSPEKGTYRSLDPAAMRMNAENSPELFLRQVESWPLVIDEAHKAPALFDEIKSIVDLKRRPGQFVLSGSVQFSTHDYRNY
jgi:predicted AAA+ superfamily ATPase